MYLRADQKRPRHGSPSIGYWARAWLVAEGVVDLIARDQAAMSHLFQYKQLTSDPRLSAAQVKKTYLDLALTIGVHPWALGVIPENNGKVHLPKRLTIEYTVVKNIIRWSRGSEQSTFEKRTRLEDDQTLEIPPLIKDLTVVKGKGTKPVAVIVVEHQILRTVITDERYNKHRVIVVMTAGYPSLATREFLHLLSKSPMLNDVPFLYFSDHDFQAAEIFKCLKYGAAHSAESSEQMVCSQLSWAGPSREELLSSPEKCRKALEQQYQSDQLRATSDEVKGAADAWVKNKRAFLEKKLVKTTQGDLNQLRSFLQTSWLQNEAGLRAELDEMSWRKGKFRLADLAAIHQDFVQIFINAKISKALAIESAEELSLPGPLIPKKRGWAALSGQQEARQKASAEVSDEEAEALMQYVVT
ncbi:uncharacterized protein KY384_004628 [Bacidia gigantensis]|uniref:uncharacterized protein n=1 Tax=Bacidia gigantensis TaxID=2732470 RepID=UPI001D04A5B9|nr:uncharacterized protein KY384_004628 [Bacidia gigantensis]KAG8531270.1 hypothetical protein KY384_004628 [Bacidia gigantensis]